MGVINDGRGVDGWRRLRIVYCWTVAPLVTTGTALPSFSRLSFDGAGAGGAYYAAPYPAARASDGVVATESGSYNFV